MPHPTAKLLQVLQDGQVFPIGAQEGKPVQVRTICATHRPLERDIRNGTFRPDLFYRINVVTFHLPPLRERREDIPDLIRYFTTFYARKYGQCVKPLSDYCLRLLQEQGYRQSRELENLVNRYAILGSEAVVTDQSYGPLESPEPAPPEGQVVSLREAARQAARAAERRLIMQVSNTMVAVLMPRALNEPVGFSPSSLISRLACWLGNIGVNPSPSVTGSASGSTAA